MAMDLRTCLALGQLVQVSHKLGPVDVIRDAALSSKSTMSCRYQPASFSGLANASPCNGVPTVRAATSKMNTFRICNAYLKQKDRQGPYNALRLGMQVNAPAAGLTGTATLIQN